MTPKVNVTGLLENIHITGELIRKKPPSPSRINSENGKDKENSEGNEMNNETYVQKITCF